MAGCWQRVTLRRTSPAEAQAVFISSSLIHRRRLSFVAEVDAALYQLFQPGDHHIAQLELAMILYGLVTQLRLSLQMVSWVCG